MKPLQPAAYPESELYPSRIAREFGCTLAEAIDLAADLRTDTVYRNDVYQVNFRRHDPPPGSKGLPMVHLSIKRIDRRPVRDWRDVQQIKNQLVGAECEGVELYPAESRLVDMANQFHIWVVAEPSFRFPFGFNQGRNVTEHDYADGSKARQRPIEPAT